MKRFSLSFICYSAAVAAAFLLLRADGGRWFKLLTWVRSYATPDLGIACVAVLLVSLAWTLFILGLFEPIEIQGWKVNTRVPALNYIFGLPIWLTASFLLVSILALLTISPTCDVPSVIFSARAGSSEAREFTPDSTVEVNDSGSVIVFVKSYPPRDPDKDEDLPQDELSCDIQAMGPSVERVGSTNHHACALTIFIKQGSQGDNLVTADIRGRYCQFSSVYTLNLRVK